MPNENEEQVQIIKVCLEQKVILMTRLLDVTKEIEIQSLQEDINIASQLRIRHDLMKRIEKCDAVIKTNTSLLSSTLAESIRKDLYMEDIDQVEVEEIYRNSIQWRKTFQKVKEIDARAKENLNQRLEEAKKNLSESRRNTMFKDGSLFR